MDSWIQRNRPFIVGGVVLLTVFQLIGGMFLHHISGSQVIGAVAGFLVQSAIIYFAVFLFLEFQIRFIWSSSVTIRVFMYFIMAFAAIALVWFVIAQAVTQDINVIAANGALMGMFLSAHHVKRKHFPQEGAFNSAEEKAQWIKSAKWQLKTLGVLIAVLGGIGLFVFLMFWIACY
ncbi:MAG: hypothetical protein ACM3MK_03730 [Chitinophagales bacterium]